MTDAAESDPPLEELLGEVVTTDARRVGRERHDFHLLRRHSMTDVASDLGVFFSLVIESGALAADSPRPLSNGRSGVVFCVRREPKVYSRRQKAGQSEYALFDSQHRQVILRASPV